MAQQCEYCNAIKISKHSPKIQHLTDIDEKMTKEAPLDNKNQHSLAGSRMSGADMVIQVLADENVDTIFGYSGGAILPTYDAVFRFNDKHRKADVK